MDSSQIDSVGEIERLLQSRFFARHPAASVQPLEQLSRADLIEVFERQPVQTMLPIWERLSPEIGKTLLSALPAAIVIETMRGLDPVRLAQLLTRFDEDERERLLALTDSRIAKEVRAVAFYPPDRAGALMEAGAQMLRQSSTVAEVLVRLRQDRRPGLVGIFVVDSDNRLLGWVDMQDLALSEPGERVGELVQDVRAVVDPMAPREEVAEKMEEHRLSDLAVIDLDRKLMGVIRYASMVAAEKEYAAIGIQTMVGVSKDERALSKVSFAVLKRLPWLQVNLVTAFVAASVVGLFESTIAQYTALAVLLPVVAGQSGNTGAQALAVTMRGLALREIRTRHWPRVVFKETNVAFLNGVAVALTTAVCVLVWSDSYGLALIIAISMVLSMIVAGIAGAAIPIVLTMLRQDPAQSSSIILTTVTDVAGFFSFLGIATVLAQMI